MRLKCDRFSRNQTFISLCIKGWGIFKWGWNCIFYSSAWGVMICCSLHMFSCPCFSNYTTHYIYFQFPLGKETVGQFCFAFSQGKKMLAWIFASCSGEGPLKEIWKDVLFWYVWYKELSNAAARSQSVWCCPFNYEKQSFEMRFERM